MTRSTVPPGWKGDGLGVPVGYERQLTIGVQPEEGAERREGCSLIGATREHPGWLSVGSLDEIDLADLEYRASLRRSPGRLPRSTANQVLLDSWVALLSPYFDHCEAASLTLTYSDDYGYRNGLMLPRNVRSDFLRALAHCRPGFVRNCQGIEHHNTGRLILHSHGMLGGDWSQSDRDDFKSYWDNTRGWSRVEAVTERGGCVAYCAKHLLKRGAADLFDFQVTPPARAGSRQSRREAAAGW